MCDDHDQWTVDKPGALNRRLLLKLGAASVLSMGLTGTGGKALAAKEKGSPPLPENVMAPEAALDRLMEGNARYVAGKSTPPNFAIERAALVTGQNPYATVLGCSDSRVSPEFCFDEQRGDLFVARVAGNYLTTDFVATVEYATVVLHTPLIMVLGHQACGAVRAAINAVDNHEQFPGHIQSIASALAPAVRAARGMPGDRFDNVVKMNVIRTVEKLQKQPPLLSKLVAERRLLIAGGVYNLTTGRVDQVA
jgi:carbonic anhydrase